MPGCAVNTGTEMEAPTVPAFDTAMVALGPLATSHGTWKLICCCPLTLSTANRATGVLLTINESFKNVLGSGRTEVTLMPVADVRLAPNAVAISPGTTPPPAKLAPFTTAVIKGAKGPPLQVQ